MTSIVSFMFLLLIWNRYNSNLFVRVLYVKYCEYSLLLCQYPMFTC